MTVAWLWNVYGWLYDGLRGFYPYQHLVDLTVGRLDVKPGQDILDVGCGTGNLLERVGQAKGTHLTGIDLSPGMLRVAKRKLAPLAAAGRLELIGADAVTGLAGLPDAAFDRIVSVNVLYALSVKDRARVWREAGRVLKPGGILVINNSTQTGSFGIIREHLAHASWWRLFAPRLVGVFIVDSLINLMGDAGHFEFPDEQALRREAEQAGWHWVRPERCYGGVNVLAVLER